LVGVQNPSSDVGQTTENDLPQKKAVNSSWKTNSRKKNTIEIK
jgi:hypothetical protein